MVLMVTPLDRWLEVELSATLEVGIKLGFGGLHAHDLSVRARTF